MAANCEREVVTLRVAVVMLVDDLQRSHLCHAQSSSVVLGPDLQKYLATILRLSYDNAKATIDLRRTSHLQNVLRRTQGFSEARFTFKVVRSSETVFANLLTIFIKEIVTTVSRSYDKLTIILR